MAVLFLKRVNLAKDLTVQLKAMAPVKDLSPERLKFLSTGSPAAGQLQSPPNDPPRS